MTSAVSPVVGPPTVPEPHDDFVDRQVRNLRFAGVAMAAGAAVLPRLPAVGPLCAMRRFTGVPCPFCGMTTGVIALSRGDVGAALAANPLSLLLIAAVLVAFLPVVVRRALPLGTSPATRRRLPWLLAPVWLFELHRYELI